MDRPHTHLLFQTWSPNCTTTVQGPYLISHYIFRIFTLVYLLELCENQIGLCRQQKALRGTWSVKKIWGRGWSTGLLKILPRAGQRLSRRTRVVFSNRASSAPFPCSSGASIWVMVEGTQRQGASGEKPPHSWVLGSSPSHLCTSLCPLGGIHKTGSSLI